MTAERVSLPLLLAAALAGSGPRSFHRAGRGRFEGDRAAHGVQAGRLVVRQGDSRLLMPRRLIADGIRPSLPSLEQ